MKTIINADLKIIDTSKPFELLQCNYPMHDETVFFAARKWAENFLQAPYVVAIFKVKPIFNF